MIGNSAVGIFVEPIPYISHAAADSHHVEITDAAECRAQVSHRPGYKSSYSGPASRKHTENNGFLPSVRSIQLVFHIMSVPLCMGCHGEQPPTDLGLRVSAAETRAAGLLSAHVTAPV